MSHQHEPLLVYKHQDLITRFNELMIIVKVHLYHPEIIEKHPKLSLEELTKIESEIFQILYKDSKPIINK